MYFPEYFKQLGVSDCVWVEVYSSHFSVSSLACHNVIVSWIVEVASCVARDNVADPVDV